MKRLLCVSGVLVMLTLSVPVQAQTAAPAPAPAVADDPDLDTNFAQPDYTLAALPTTLRLPRFKSAFRVTHRFTRALGEGDFTDLLSDFFGLDNGSRIGLEYRFGIMRGAQIGIHRTSDRAIQFFGQYEAVQQGDSFPLTIDALATAEGADNFSENYSPHLAP